MRPISENLAKNSLIKIAHMPTRPPTYRPPYAVAAKAQTQREYDRRRAADPRLAAAAKLRSSQAWRQLAGRFLAVHPICGSCRAELAAQVHHLEPVESRPDLALDWDNLAPVCTGCHAACNSVERRGESTAYLFAGFVRQPQFGGLA